MSTFKLSERAILIKLSFGMPGKSRKDSSLTQSVKSEHSLGEEAGAWVKAKYPKWALKPIQQLIDEARAFHRAVTLVFDEGIGILPGPLVLEYSERMREFAGRFENLCQTQFRDKYPEIVEWAKATHNGSFDPDDYPAVEEVMEAFYFRTEPLPVPEAGHFTTTMRSLLGVDADSVDARVADTVKEAQRELMRRLIEPVRAMAKKLNEEPKVGKDGRVRDDIVFRDTLVENIAEIVKLAPKLNLSGDAQIDAFAVEMQSLISNSAETLRKDKAIRSDTATKAAETLKRLEGYAGIL